MTDTATPLQFPTNDEIWAMSPAVAKAKLEELHNAYVGSPEKREPPPMYDGEGKQVGPAPVGIVSSHELDARRAQEGIAHLEEKGFPARGTPEGDDMWNMLEGRTVVPPELEKQVRLKWASLERDVDWRRRFFDGDPVAVREFHLATGILAAARIQREQTL